MGWQLGAFYFLSTCILSGRVSISGVGGCEKLHLLYTFEKIEDHEVKSCRSYSVQCLLTVTVILVGLFVLIHLVSVFCPGMGPLQGSPSRVKS